VAFPLDGEPGGERQARRGRARPAPRPAPGSTATAPRTAWGRERRKPGRRERRAGGLRRARRGWRAPRRPGPRRRARGPRRVRGCLPPRRPGRRAPRCLWDDGKARRAGGGLDAQANHRSGPTLFPSPAPRLENP
jgi:hypothetical protein